MTSRLRPAHGVALLFLANGLVGPSLWPRLPEIRDSVGATDATLGLALVNTGLGTLAATARVTLHRRDHHAANEWSALTLQDGLGASIALAGLGPTAYAGAMLVGRLFGDRGIDRFGARRMARFGAAAVAVGGGLGLGLASWLQVPAVLVAGLVVAGIGTATLFPLMLQAGDALDSSGRGVAAASLGARAGFLAVPVSMGLISHTAGPVVAFALLPIVGLVAAVALPAALDRDG